MGLYGTIQDETVAASGLVVSVEQFWNSIGIDIVLCQKFDEDAPFSNVLDLECVDLILAIFFLQFYLTELEFMRIQMDNVQIHQY